MADAGPTLTSKLQTRLLHAFQPGDVISLYEAMLALRDRHEHAHLILQSLYDAGTLDEPVSGLWVMAGAAPDPYSLAARVIYPYALVGATALRLHLGIASPPSEVTIATPNRFRSFEYEGVRYRRAGRWDDPNLIRIRTPAPEDAWSLRPLGFDGMGEVVTTTSLERAVVDAVRRTRSRQELTALADLTGDLPPLNGANLLHALGRHAAPVLTDRLIMLLRLTGVARRQASLIAAIQRRAEPSTTPRPQT